MLTRLWLTIALFSGLACSAPASSDPCATAPLCREGLQLETGWSVPYYRSLPLTPSDTVTRAVIIVHGNRRDADRYFGRLVEAARLEGRLADTLLLAPHFRTLDDQPSAQEHYWSSSGWKIGNRSRDPKHLSSFRVIDELLGRVCGSARALFPGLETVVIAGHSAGGQFVNRYIAGGEGCADPGVELRFVVMNPSSYLYLDGRRPNPDDDAFSIPRTHCWDYDEYKYGLSDLNAYMQERGVERLQRNLFERRSYYLAGEDDIKKGSSLDQSCEGTLQGTNRLARHANYREYAALFDRWKESVFLTVPGVGHDGGKMLSSEQARRILFR